MLTLLETQLEFAHLTPRLLDYVLSLGYKFTWGDAYRDPRVFGKLGESKAVYGHPSSAHKVKLAIDINLFVGGTYLSQTASHAPIGEWWEKQHELARWGGRFGDGNHYSFEYRGVR